jgi:hypothetical protein
MCLIPYHLIKCFVFSELIKSFGLVQCNFQIHFQIIDKVVECSMLSKVYCVMYWIPFPAIHHCLLVIIDFYSQTSQIVYISCSQFFLFNRLLNLFYVASNCELDNICDIVHFTFNNVFLEKFNLFFSKLNSIF